ncbi:MAG TPA: branched-chain amino acid ABC transporter permease [Rugosimonospora sp.]|nr:branched-chain amino acid ABC transporter permease [Rugosimonospora sp.]
MTVLETAPPPPAATLDRPVRPRWALVRRLLPLVALVVGVALPWSTAQVPVLFDAPLNAPGTLQILAGALVFGGLAIGYDLLFGRSGLLSFGHALFIALGAYGADILVNHAHWPLWLAALGALGGGTLLALLVGAVSLRTTGIAFAMVTLAFAQVGAILVDRDPGGLTGGEEGLPLDGNRLPGALVGVVNTVNLYWLALAFLVVCVFVVHRIDRAPLGRVLAGLRDDERRVGVLGLSPYRYKLAAFTVSGALATLGGVVYCLLYGGASPALANSNLTVSLLVMVVLGGAGRAWGPVLGGIVYSLLDQRLTASGAHLPGPLAQPLFVLGAVFILVVYFVPGGLAGLSRWAAATGGPLRRLARVRAVRRTTGSAGPGTGAVP